MEIHETGVALTMASLPHETVLHFRSCSRGWRTVFQDESVLQNATVDLRSAKPRTFCAGSAFVECWRLLQGQRWCELRTSVSAHW